MNGWLYPLAQRGDELRRVELAAFLKPGKSGTAELIHFHIDKDNLRAVLRDGISPGRYVRLTIDGSVFMSDTPMEWHTCQPFIRKAFGNVLVAGLGLGMMLKPLLAKRQVQKVTVLELSPDVLKLVAPAYRLHRKLSIIQADAWTWKPPKGERYDAIWLDIWPNPGDECQAEAKRLARRFQNWRRSRDYSLLLNWPDMAERLL